MPGMAQFLQEVHRVAVVIDLHPAASQLTGRVRVGSGRRDLAKISCQRRRGMVGCRLAPRVVRLDDVDSVRQLDYALSPEVVPSAIQRVRQIGEPAHLVDVVHHLFGSKVWTQLVGDEQTDDLALPRLGLLADDRELGLHPRELQSALDRVVVGESDSI